MPVSVRELRAHLSQYLKIVQNGESVVVTLRNQPVAKLSPIEPLPDSRNEIDRLRSATGIHWDGEKPSGCQVKLQKEGKTAGDIVLEDRE